MAPKNFGISRVIDAPRTLVWRAWSDPNHLRKWWGPEGVLLEISEFQFRSGGGFRYYMKAPDGIEMFGRFSFKEVILEQRIVYLDSFADEHGNPVPPTHYGMSADWPAEPEVTLLFIENEGQTELIVETSVPLEIAERHKAKRGWISLLDRLEAFLNKTKKEVS